MSGGKDLMKSIAEEFELLERHIAILRNVRENQPIGLIRLSETTGIPRHKVRYSLKLLEQQGIIRATPEGATVTDDYESFMESTTEYIKGLYARVESLLEKLV